MMLLLLQSRRIDIRVSNNDQMSIDKIVDSADGGRISVGHARKQETAFPPPFKQQHNAIGGRVAPESPWFHKIRGKVQITCSHLTTRNTSY